MKRTDQRGHACISVIVNGQRALICLRCGDRWRRKSGPERDCPRESP